MCSGLKFRDGDDAGMSALTDEDRLALVDVVDRLLTDVASTDTLRDTVKAEPKFDTALWTQMAELGLLGLLVDEAHGGAGGDSADLQAIMEVMGARLLPSPYLSTAVFAASLIQASTDSAYVTSRINAIMDGAVIYAVVRGNAAEDWRAPTDMRATRTGDKWHLDGAAGLALDASRADRLLITASNREEVGVYEVAVTDAAIDSLQTDDPSLSLASVTLAGAPAIRLSGVSDAAVERALHLTLTGFAAEQAGATQEIFNRTIQYLKDRYQFGRQIGSYQALKHMAADLLVETESAVTVSRQAALALAADKPEARQLVYLAAFACADNFRTVASEAIQMHGGIAYTKEHDAHLFWRRARAGEWLYATSDTFRELYLQTWEAAA
jgi:alkylation response protein AidB-like acyl-CoA dehydrogenase